MAATASCTSACPAAHWEWICGRARRSSSCFFRDAGSTRPGRSGAAPQATRRATRVLDDTVVTMLRRLRYTFALGTAPALTPQEEPLCASSQEIGRAHV